jgi:hypothetical protein
VPERIAEASAPTIGVHPLDQRTSFVVLDGEEEGARSIADAVRLASALIPGPDELKRPPAAPLVDGFPLLTERPLTFNATGNGLDGLESGWAYPEPWGTWSIGSTSIIRIAVPRTAGPTVRLGLDYRTIPLPDGAPRVFGCSVGDSRWRWEFDAHNSAGQIVIEATPGDSPVLEIVVTNHDPRSPAELSLGTDTRRIAFGVERISLLSTPQ